MTTRVAFWGVSRWSVTGSRGDWLAIRVLSTRGGVGYRHRGARLPAMASRKPTVLPPVRLRSGAPASIVGFLDSSAPREWQDRYQGEQRAPRRGARGDAVGRRSECEALDRVVAAARGRR